MTTQKTDNNQKLVDRLNQLNQYKIDLGLERLRTVYSRLNLSQFKPQVITVGGTNGKGSTVAALCALLAVKQHSVGAFTSPHIFQFNERIAVNGDLATDVEILNAFEAIDKAAVEIKLSYFEYAFLAAMLIFRDHQTEYVVLEVGLGGRLDATNVVDADAAIITTVDLDHTEWLGDDIESIAKEKAGIMRSQSPTIYADKNTPEAIKQQASYLGGRLIEYDVGYRVMQDTSGFSYSYNNVKYNDLPLPKLKGRWQLKNFSAALTALLSLGHGFTRDELVLVLQQWQLPGRMQTIQQHPLVLADVAHNRQSVKKLAQWLKNNPIQGVTRAVFSVLGDKRLDDWIGVMSDVVDHWFIFQLDGPRAMKINDLKLTLIDHVNLISQYDSAKQAYQVALLSSEPEDRVIIFGSFHVLDEVLRTK